MSDNRSTLSFTIDSVLRAVLILICAGFIAIDLFVIFSRMFYPYELEWMEGASLIQVQRLITSQALYVPPSIDYVPLVYPPLYFYASAGLASLIGFGFGALRLVSFLSSLMCAVVIYLIVIQTTQSRFAAWVAAGCFASMFLLTGQWFDIARTDMFAVALSLLGIYFAHEKDNFQQLEIILAGLLFALAFLTKQIALLIALAAIAYYAIFNWRRAIWLGISFLISVFGLYVMFWMNSAGWINYYLFTLPATHIFKFNAGRIVSILLDEFGRVPIFLILAILPILIAPRSILSDKPHRYYLVMIAALLAAGLAGRVNTFSSDNAYIPAYLGLAVLVGFEVGWLLKKNPSLQNTLPIMILEWTLLSAQLIFLALPYFQIKMIPSAQDRSAGDALVEKIKSFPGDVVLLDNNYLALYAGKKTYYNDIPMSELSGQGTLYAMPEWGDLQSRINQLIHAPTTSAIIVSYEGSIKSVIADCKKQPIPYPDRIMFQPVAGPPKSRPNLIVTCR